MCSYRQLFRDSLGLDPMDVRSGTHSRSRSPRVDSASLTSIGDDRDTCSTCCFRTSFNQSSANRPADHQELPTQPGGAGKPSGG